MNQTSCMYVLKTTPLLPSGWRKPQIHVTREPKQDHGPPCPKILLSIHSSPFLCLMVDEATDVSNKEQLIIIIWCVDEDLNIFEEILGLYHFITTDAASIVATIKDVLLRLQVPFSKLRG